MNYNNTLNNLSPILISGYRGEIEEDLNLKQGKKYLYFENNIKNEIKPIMHKFFNNNSSYKASNNSIFKNDGNLIENFKNENDNDNNKNIINLKNQYNTILNNYNDKISYFTYNYKKLNKNDRITLINNINDLANRLSFISEQLNNSIIDYSNEDIDSNNKIKKQIKYIRNLTEKINKDRYNFMYNLDNTNIYAEQESTHLLVKERFYRYLLWGLITILIISITVYIMIDTRSSTSIILLMLLILIVFLLFMYKYYNYYIMNPFENINIPKFNFNPLVSIKYTN